MAEETNKSYGGILMAGFSSLVIGVAVGVLVFRLNDGNQDLSTNSSHPLCLSEKKRASVFWC